MKKLVFLLALFLVFRPAHSAIYDCFLFFNELEILKIRLHELYNYVDKFVLVESVETFRGDSKPLFFQENKKLFEQYLDKIVHVIVEDTLQTHTAWERETFQRNQILRGLTTCVAKDLILISDVDEIIRPLVFDEFNTKLSSIPANSQYKMVLCKMPMYRYFFNCYDAKDSPWPGSIGIYFSDLQKTTPEICRTTRTNSPYIINDAGWHLTYMGGYERVLQKLASFSHAEYDTPYHRDLKTIEQKIAAMVVVQIDETFPQLIYDNQEYYKKNNFIK